MVKIEFSGWKVLAELGMILLISPCFIALKLGLFNYFKWNNDNIIFSIIFYAIMWRFLKYWTQGYEWIQEKDWDS